MSSSLTLGFSGREEEETLKSGEALGKVSWQVLCLATKTFILLDFNLKACSVTLGLSPWPMTQLNTDYTTLGHSVLHFTYFPICILMDSCLMFLATVSF